MLNFIYIVKMERLSRNRYWKFFSRSTLFIWAQKGLKIVIFTYTCYYFSLREPPDMVHFIRDEVILHEKLLSCGYWDVKLNYLHDLTTRNHVPRYCSRTRIFPLEGISNFITKNAFSGVWSFPHSRTAQKYFFQKVVGSQWIHPLIIDKDLHRKGTTGLPNYLVDEKSQ